MKFPIVTPKKTYSDLRKIVSCPGNLEKYKRFVEIPPNYFDNFIRFKDVLGMID